jgi:hypothetical protein
MLVVIFIFVFVVPAAVAPAVGVPFFAAPGACARHDQHVADFAAGTPGGRGSRKRP